MALNSILTNQSQPKQQRIEYFDQKIGRILFIIGTDNNLYLSEWGRMWKFKQRRRNGEQTLYLFEYGENIKEYIFESDLFTTIGYQHHQKNNVYALFT